MKRLLAVTLVLALAASSRAAFEDLGAGARAPGMGDAFTALADDAYAVHYNPAGLSQLDRPEFGAGYSRLFTGLSDGSDVGTSNLVYAQPWSRGKKGTFGLEWDRFALSGLYQEQTMSLAYGRRVWSPESGGQLSVGLAARYLTHSFATPAEAANACNAGNCVYGADPLLSGKNSRSVPDADLGLLYRLPEKFQVGMTLNHLMSPSVGFGGSDKLNRGLNIGAAYRSLWMSVIGELKLAPNASSGMDRLMIIAGERYFPTLDYGSFGVRGSVGYGLGGGDWRQITMGGSYQVNKIRADYAYILPVGTIQGQSGSHRVSMTFLFGAPTTEEEIGRELLEQAKRLKELGPDYGAGFTEDLKPQGLEDPRFADVRSLIEQRRYRAAQVRLVKIAGKDKLTPPLIRLSNRLQLVAYHYAELPEPANKFDKTLTSAIHRFLYADDRLAILQTSYAANLHPEDARMSHLMEDMEKAVSLPATRLPSDNPRGFIDELLYQVEYANNRGNAQKAEEILNDVLVLEPDSSTALERLGSLRYLAGKMIDALKIWDEALKLEKDAREIESLREYMRLAKEHASGQALPGGVVPLAPKPAEAASPTTPAPAAAPRARAPRRAAPPGDIRDVQKLYQKGVEHYARGEYLQATAMFLRILKIDPTNEPARKALQRIDRGRKTQ